MPASSSTTSIRAGSDNAAASGPGLASRLRTRPQRSGRPRDGVRPACCGRQARVAKIVVSAEGMVDAPAETVYGYIADMREHHPHFLPPAFSDFQVESGGVGE